MKMTPSLGGGKEGQVFTEQDFVVEAPQAHVTYGPLTCLEIKPETVWYGGHGNTFGAALPEVDSYPGLTEPLPVSFDEPRRLNDHATDYQRLTSEDEDRIREFWLVHAGHELHVWSLRLNELSDRRATHEQQQEGEGERFHLTYPAVVATAALLKLELHALERIRFYFGKFVDAAGEVHRQDFLHELCVLVNREEWKQHLREVCSKVQ